MKLAGKAAVITGSGAGIGEATSLLFAREGAAVCVNSVSESGLKVVRTITRAGGTAVWVRGDVAEEADARNIISEAVKAFGRLDILFNNAGIVAEGSVETGSIEDFDRNLAVNVRGVFLCARFALPHLKKTRGTIINCSSSVALKGVADRAAYSASKGAVFSLTRAMAMDHIKDGIRVNAICPGTTDTPSLKERLTRKGDYAEMRKLFIARQPMGRLGTPEEIAEGVLFLALNPFCTGTALSIDGGMTI